ncbi:MAG: F0F1 ATP synthase subunit gamma [Rhodoblastus sp.]|nr:MAG: F0F1 ATP synthase subunit gamma [Rhodoblastus sp.]
MASLKELRNRIASVKATQKITKAMQMVAAAKLRRAQMAAEAARPTRRRWRRRSQSRRRRRLRRKGPALLAGNGRDQTHLLIVCTAERGLCGAFNSAIVRLAREHILRLQGQGKTVKILCVGKKGLDQLRRQYGSLLLDPVDLRGVRQLSFADGDAIAKKVLAMFEAGEFDVATLFFSKFQSVISQIPTAQQLIPAQVGASASGKPAAATSYEYEPDQGEILNELLPRNVSVQVFRALLENAASEQGARMSAMDSATRNAGEMIRKQTLTYNRTRQAMITKELIEIISGAEAL